MKVSLSQEVACPTQVVLNIKSCPFEQPLICFFIKNYSIGWLSFLLDLLVYLSSCQVHYYRRSDKD